MFELFKDPDTVTAVSFVLLMVLCVLAPFVGVWEHKHSRKRDEHEYRDRQRELMKWENELKRKESRLGE